MQYRLSVCSSEFAAKGVKKEGRSWWMNRTQGRHPAIKKALTVMSGLNKKSLEGQLPIVRAKLTQIMEK